MTRTVTKTLADLRFVDIEAFTVRETTGIDEEAVSHAVGANGDFERQLILRGLVDVNGRPVDADLGVEGADKWGRRTWQFIRAAFGSLNSLTDQEVAEVIEGAVLDAEGVTFHSGTLGHLGFSSLKIRFATAADERQARAAATGQERRFLEELIVRTVVEVNGDAVDADGARSWWQGATTRTRTLTDRCFSVVNSATPEELLDFALAGAGAA